MKEIVKRVMESRIVRSLTPALVGFIGYGGWALGCNLSHGLDMGLKSGFVQGTISFFITIVSNLLMETVYRFTGSRVITIVTSIFTFVGTSFTVNYIVGTPEILLTIAPGALIGSIYTISYVATLHKVEKAKATVEGQESGA